MEFHEFGNPNAPAVLINHGMMQHWRSQYELLSPLQAHYRLIFTAMDGLAHGEFLLKHSSEACEKIRETLG